MTNSIKTALMEWVITHPYDIIIPNFFWGRYEMDVFKLNRGGYVTEYEIKVSKADFKNDLKKGVMMWNDERNAFIGDKHWNLLNKSSKCNRFFYVVPTGLLTVKDIPKYAGLIEYTNRFPFFNTLKSAPLLHKNKFEDHFEIAQRLSFRERGLRTKLKKVTHIISNNTCMRSYDKMLTLYEQHKGKTIITDKYEAVVCGFHYEWDDNDAESMIVAITKEKSIRPGMHYTLHGDVYRTHHQNRLGFDYIHLKDFNILIKQIHNSL